MRTSRRLKVAALAVVSILATWLSVTPASATSTYTLIVNYYSQQCMGPYNNSSSPGAVIMQYNCTDSDPWMHWELGYDAYGQIINEQTHMCLTPYGNSTNPGADLIQATCMGQPNQGWYWRSGQIINSANNLCVSVGGNGVQINITQQQCSSSGYEIWDRG